jgi:hypothetical protein
LLLLWATLAGCHTVAVGDSGGLVVRDGGFGDLPPRTVVTDFPDAPFAFDAAVPTIGGGTVAGSDAGTPDPTTTPDAAADAAPGNGACSVLLQDCGAGKGCYPVPGSAAACTVAGDLGDSTPCGEHSQCAPGLLCVDAFGAGSRQCEPACDTTVTGSCSKGDTCRPYAGTLGFCTQ